MLSGNKSVMCYYEDFAINVTNKNNKIFCLEKKYF